MIRRPPRSTPKPSSAASDVYKRQGYRRPITSFSCVWWVPLFPLLGVVVPTTLFFVHPPQQTNGLRDILCVFSCVQPTLFSRLSWGSTDDQCRYRILSARRPLPVDLLRFTNAGQRKIGKIAPKPSKSPLTWVGRRNEVDRNTRAPRCDQNCARQGLCASPWLYATAQRTGGWF